MEFEIIESGTAEMQNEVADERDEDPIARRAYQIHASGEGSTDFDNWLRAERELREEQSWQVD